MLIDPQRAQAKLDTALAQIRVKARMRFGIVAGVVMVGLFQTDFNAPPFGALLPGMPLFIVALVPLLALALIGALVIMGLRQRDVASARAEYDKTTFKIPTRKTSKL